MILFFKKHSLATLFLGIIIFLSYGIIVSYGWEFIPNLLLLIIPFFLIYFSGYKFISKGGYIPWLHKLEVTNKNLNLFLSISLISIIGFICVHFIMLGNIPIIKAIFSNDYYGIAEIRQEIKFLKNPLILYMSAFMIKAIIPFFLVLFYIRDRSKFWILLVVGIFYAMALMQKAFIITILIPLVIYFLWNRKWIEVGLYVVTFTLGVVFLVIVTNPSLRFWGKNETIQKTEEVQVSSQVSSALYDRVFITTGKMVGNWFVYVPDSLPFLKGDGYRFLTPFTGNEYQDYSREIYKKIYVRETKIGLEGTATTAFFMYDYANFGKWGLVMSGAFLGLILVFISYLFGKDYENLFIFNSLSILWLSSAAFTSTLFSGGWAPTVILYIVFRKGFMVSKKEDPLN